jgi:hypothetical protein
MLLNYSLSDTDVPAVAIVAIVLGCIVLFGIVMFVRRRRRARQALSSSVMSDSQDHQPLFVDKSGPSSNLEH